MRPRGNNRENLLTGGTDLIWAQGFHGTGVQEIAAAAGVPKGSFYNHFDSKDDFAVKALEKYAEDFSAHLQQVLLHGDGTPLDRLRRLFDTWIAEVEDGGALRGCLAGNLSQELSLSKPQIQAATNAAFEKLQSHYQTCLQDAQAQGQIAADLDTAALSGFIYFAWQGAILRAKASGSMQPFQQFQSVVFDRLLAG